MMIYISPSQTHTFNIFQEANQHCFTIHWRSKPWHKNRQKIPTIHSPPISRSSYAETSRVPRRRRDTSQLEFLKDTQPKKNNLRWVWLEKHIKDKGNKYAIIGSIVPPLHAFNSPKDHAPCTQASLASLASFATSFSSSQTLSQLGRAATQLGHSLPISKDHLHIHFSTLGPDHSMTIYLSLYIIAPNPTLEDTQRHDIPPAANEEASATAETAPRQISRLMPKTPGGSASWSNAGKTNGGLPQFDFAWKKKLQMLRDW